MAGVVGFLAGVVCEWRRISLKNTEQLEKIEIEWAEETDMDGVNSRLFAIALDAWVAGGRVGPIPPIGRYIEEGVTYLRCEARAFISDAQTRGKGMKLSVNDRAIRADMDDQSRVLVEYRLLQELKESIERDAQMTTKGFWEMANQSGRYRALHPRQPPWARRPGERP